MPGQPMKKGAVESSLAGSCILFCFVFPLKQILSCLNGVDELVHIVFCRWPISDITCKCSINSKVTL